MLSKKKTLLAIGALGTAFLSGCVNTTELTEGELKEKAYAYEDMLRTQVGDDSLVVTVINREEKGNLFKSEVSYNLEYSKSYGLEVCTTNILEGSEEFTDTECSSKNQK